MLHVALPAECHDVLLARAAGEVPGQVNPLLAIHVLGACSQNLHVNVVEHENLEFGFSSGSVGTTNTEHGSVGAAVVGVREVHGWGEQITRAILALGVESGIDSAACLIAKEAVPARCFGEVGKVCNRSCIGFVLCAESHLAETFVDEWNLLGGGFVGCCGLCGSSLVAESVDELLCGEALAGIALEEVLDLYRKLGFGHDLLLAL